MQQVGMRMLGAPRQLPPEIDLPGSTSVIEAHQQLRDQRLDIALNRIERLARVDHPIARRCRFARCR